MKTLAKFKMGKRLYCLCYDELIDLPFPDCQGEYLLKKTMFSLRSEDFGKLEIHRNIPNKIFVFNV